MSSTPTSGSTPPATGGSNSNNGGRKGYQGNRNNNNSPKVKKTQFKGLAGADTALYEKVVTVGPNQATQIVDVLDALVTYCGSKGYGKWAESITELTRFAEADFVGTPPAQSMYGTTTANVFTYNATGAEQYKIQYDMWKARYNHTLGDFIDYEKNASYIFLALKGQFETVAWEDLQHDARYGAIMTSQCPVRLIELLLETCSTNESSTWEPLGRIRHFRKTLTYLQKPKSAPTAIDTAQYKRHLCVYVGNASRAGGDFVFGTKFYEPFLVADGETLVSYLGMDAAGKKIYDKKVNDLIVSVLMIEGCKSKALKTNLKNLFLTGNPDCYPVTASKAYELIDKFEEDDTAAKPNPNSNKDRRSRYRKNNESRDDGNVAGAHVHDSNDTTKALVLAAVTDNGIDHQNAFKAIETQEEFEDEDMGEVACVIIGDHYYPSEDDSSTEDDSSIDYNQMAGIQPRTDLYGNSEDESESDDDPLNIMLIDGQDDSTYEDNASMDFNDEFSYDDSVLSDELSMPSLCSRHSSSSSECSTVANGDIQTVICEASYVCDTDEDSSAATFTSHNDSVIDNIGVLKVLQDDNASANITQLRPSIKMEQSVRRYLDDVIMEVPKASMINGKPSRNVAHTIDIRRRFGGSIEIIRKEEMYLGGSTTKFTLYKLSPYFNRAGEAGGIDTFNNLRDVMTCNIPGAYLDTCDIPNTYMYLDPTDDDYADFHEYQDFCQGEH